MGRPREFDRDQVLRRALDVFWANGYGGTSLDDLTGAMGISRSSLYNEFGDKHSLFLEALDLYRADRLHQLSQILQAAPSARAGIAAVLRGATSFLWSSPSRRGCLMVNSATELAASDLTVAARASEAFDRTAATFGAALERGKRTGELSPNLDVRATSRYLAHALNGVRLLARMSDREVADDIVEVTLRTLETIT